VTGLWPRRGPSAPLTAGSAPSPHTQLPLNSGLLLHRSIRYARAYTPSSADLPSFPVYSAAVRPVCATLGRASVCGRAIFQLELALIRGGTSRGRTAVIVGAQWGDEGKGKIVDVLTQTFSVVARYAGGHNAGHTVIINGKKFILQLVPGGILRPECTSVIGNGVVIDPLAFLKEVASLRAAGVKVDGNLFVSNRAQVILPYHRMMELGSENAPLPCIWVLAT